MESRLNVRQRNKKVMHTIKVFYLSKCVPTSNRPELGVTTKVKCLKKVGLTY